MATACACHSPSPPPGCADVRSRFPSTGTRLRTGLPATHLIRRNGRGTDHPQPALQAAAPPVRVVGLSHRRKTGELSCIYAADHARCSRKPQGSHGQMNALDCTGNTQINARRSRLPPGSINGSRRPAALVHHPQTRPSTLWFIVSVPKLETFTVPRHASAESAPAPALAPGGFRL